MKVFLLSDYFYPFNPGGSEWSVYELGQSLKKEGLTPLIVTLNYGAAEEENYHGMKILRLPFYKKLKSQRQVVNPIWQNNPIFFLTSAFHLVKAIRDKNPDLLHVHGKFLIPPAIIAGFITKKPVVVSIRDKQMFCSIGKCFFDAKRTKACNFFEYLTSDIPWFFQNYSKNKNFLMLAYIYLGSIWTRVAYEIIKFFARRSSSIIAISQSHKAYLEANGFSKVKVIYNTINFPGIKSTVQKNKSVLFAGKLSKGKGGEILINSIKGLAKANKISFLFAGTVEIRTNVSKRYTNFLGSVEYQKLLNLYSRVSAIILPSIYPESFGRIALEAISVGTPAIVSNIGALPEIVDDKVTGRVIEPDENEIKKAILDVVKNEERYKLNIKKRYSQLKKKFHDDPLQHHISLYKILQK